MLRILLVKPFQPSVLTICMPPLGLLYLASYVRSAIDDVHIDVIDLRLHQESAEQLADRVDIGQYDVVGVSVLNYEAESAHQLGHIIKQRWPGVITAIGGPYSHSSPGRVLDAGGFDWSFDGEAERTFARALRIQFLEQGDLREVPGLTWWHEAGNEYIENGGYDSIPDLDALPMPAWDLVDFDIYARRPNQNGWLKGTRYAAIFTSRGCPYKCNYCHDIFGKKFRWRSAENVLEEIRHLNRTYGVDEFEIIDDIFNLHKPRMRKIAEQIIEEFGERKLNFCFPNGIRADIFEPEDIALIARMGVFQLAIAIETVTPRLQKLIQKDLKFERTAEIIEVCEREGILSKGAFMIGFPTETLEELEATISYAVNSPLTWAGFYIVVPQEGTPMYDLAMRESPVALEHIALRDYYSDTSWYQSAYNVDLQKIQKNAFRRFYFKPSRMLRIIRHVNPRSLLNGIRVFLHILTIRDPLYQGRSHNDADAPGSFAGELPEKGRARVTPAFPKPDEANTVTVPLSKLKTRRAASDPRQSA